MINGINFDMIEEFLIQDVVIEVKSDSTSEGEDATSWNNVTTVNGLYVEATATEKTEFYKNDVIVSGKIFVMYGASIDKDTNRLSIGSDLFYVIEVKNPLSANEILICWVNKE